MSGSRWLYLPVIIVMAILVDWSAEGPLTRLVLGTSTLRVNTVPDGASVFLDAELIGTTPLRHELRPGNTVLKLEHPFHPTHVERLELLQLLLEQRVVRAGGRHQLRQDVVRLLERPQHLLQLRALLLPFVSGC